MKFTSVFIFAAISALANAQSQCDSVAAAIPTCASSCLASARSKVNCADSDYNCQCNPSSSSAIQAAAQGCVLSSCGAVTGVAVIGSAQAVCSCAATAVPASSSAAATSTSIDSSATTSSAAPASTPTSAPISTVAPTTTAIVSSATGSSGSEPSGATSSPVGTISPSGSIGSSPVGSSSGVSPSITPFAGDASKFAGSICGTLAAVFAAIAAF